MHSLNASIPDFGPQVQKLWTPLPAPGQERTTGGAPPVYLIPRVIRHAQITRFEGTLLMPQWVSSPFWPLLFPDGVNPIESIVGIAEFPSSEDLFLPGESGHNLFQDIPNTPVLALRLDFTKKAPPM